VTAVRQDLNDPRPDHGRVFGDHHSQGRRRAHGLAGSSAVSTVGPPIGLATFS
jgi:hypothetical protein